MVSKINSKEIQDFRDKNGREPLWTNSIFSGMPAYLISTRYPGNLLKHIDTVLRKFQMPVSVLFLSMTGFYILLLIFGLNPWLAISGSLAYGLSSFFFQILAAGHNTQAIALAYMAPMIGGIYYAYKRDAIKGAIFTAFMLALEISANHIQITYYAMLCLLVFGIVEFVFAVRNKEIAKFVKTTAILIVPFIIAIGINFASLYTTYEYGKYSMRGKSDLVLKENNNLTSGLDKPYILNYSYGIDETINMMIPNYKGGGSHPFDRDSETFRALSKNNQAQAINQTQKYWGNQPPTEGPHYIGAIVVFLFVLGLVLIKGVEKWWLLSATVLAIMLAWGKNLFPFSNFFIEFFPGYNKFRAVTMTLVIAEFCIPLLGFLALRDIFNGTASKKDIIKGLKIAAGITGGFSLLALIIPGIAGSFSIPSEAEYPEWLKSALIADRKSLLQVDAFRSLFFIIASAGIIFAYLFEKLKKEQAILIISLLIVVDLWTVDKRFLNSDRFEKQSVIQKSLTPSVADAEILKDKSYYRVLNYSYGAGGVLNDNTSTSYFHKSVGGYHGAKLKRYAEFIDSSLIRDFQTIQTVGSAAKTLKDFQKAFKTTPALNMLNTKYLIFNPDVPPLLNPNNLGNAWFVEKPVIVENANAELSTVYKIDPAREAVIDKMFGKQINKQEYKVLDNENIALASYQPDELIYKYSAKEEKLVVFSEIYYPAGWKSYVDGKETDYFRANYILRGMVVPAGDHEIKFSFKPASFYSGNKVSLASSILLILLTAGYFVFSMKLKKN